MKILDVSSVKLHREITFKGIVRLFFVERNSIQMKNRYNILPAEGDNTARRKTNDIREEIILLGH